MSDPNTPNTKERLKKIFLKIFHCDSPQETTSPDNLPGWDSLGHLLLTSAIEEEFNIQLTMENILQMVNFRSIHEIVEEHLSSL